MSIKMKGAWHCPLRATKMETPIPITIPITYDTYACLYSQGLLASYLCETICPKYPSDCSSQSPPTALELTNSTVDRTAFTLEKDDYGIDTVVEGKVKIVSYYYTPGVDRGISRGQILAAPTDSTVIQGRIAIDQAVRILEKKDYIKHVGPALYVVTQKNHGDFDPSSTLAPNGFKPVFNVE